ncbi:MAG TPA: hypothetical protein PLD23_17480 [Armatimonadota bacterium]|nr:hypothetical protein [Armatimonadota bacterium]HQK95294.1 hypothetical protein [Armatimonadota bacterium]
MNKRGMNPKSKLAIIITVLACVVVLAVALFLRAQSIAAVARSNKTLEETKQRAEEVASLVASESSEAATLERLRSETAFVSRLARDAKQAQELAQQGVPNVILQADFVPAVLRDLEVLGRRTGVEVRSVKPGIYKKLEIRKKPQDEVPATDEEARKKAEEAWNKMSAEEKRPIEKDHEYDKVYKVLTRSASLLSMDIEVAGQYSALFEFIKGLAYPAADGWRLRELVAVRNIRLEAERDPHAKDVEPNVRAYLSAVAFAVRPPTPKADAEKKDSGTSSDGGGGGEGK